MRRFKRNKLNNINLIEFIGASILIIVCIFFAVKSYQNKYKVKNISEKQLASRYYEKNVFVKPKNLQTPNKILSIVPKNEYRIPIIMYHYVEYVKDPLDTIRQSLNINPYIFEQELKTLNENNYQSFFVRDIPKFIKENAKPPLKSIILTFDDGYEDFYTDAFPLLQKYKIKATVYIVDDFIGRKGFLNEKEIMEIIDSKLVEIGSHTLDHFYLKKSPKIISSKQIIDSKKILEDKFKIKVETFAYPYGAFDQESLDLVKSAGYTAAVSVIPGIVQSEDNLFYLSRFRAGNFSYSNMINYFEKYRK